jgi:Domain of unknown function (DUF4333)
LRGSPCTRLFRLEAVSLDQAGPNESTSGGAARRGPDPAAPFGCPVVHDQVVHDQTVHDQSGEAGSKSRRSKRGYFIPGLIALVVLAVGGGLANFAGIDHAGPNRLAGPDVETFLGQAIEAQDHLASAPSIRCPASEPVRVGLTFTCTWQRAAGNRPVTVAETDARGQFRFSVGRGGT